MLHAARRLTEAHRRGDEVVAVVSAQGQTTDEMIAWAAQVNPRPSRQELDAYLAAGEQMSASLMAMAIGALGGKAISMTGWQAGIRTDSSFGAARIVAVDPDPIRAELVKGRIVVAAGFQGVDETGRITTLGRGGSDTTAVALAAALGADKCQIFTDVDGIYDRDPRRFSDRLRGNAAPDCQRGPGPSRPVCGDGKRCPPAFGGPVLLSPGTGDHRGPHGIMLPGKGDSYSENRRKNEKKPLTKERIHGKISG